MRQMDQSECELSVILTHRTWLIACYGKEEHVIISEGGLGERRTNNHGNFLVH